MMYAKLALRNVRRTARDYLIYVVTLVLSVGMFYGFFSLVSPYYNATLPVPIHLDVLKKMMRIAVPLVGLFVVFLMSYVCLLYTSPSPRDRSLSRMPSSA